MTKQMISFLIAVTCSLSVSAQSPPVQVPQSYPYPPGLNTNELGVGGLSFSNRLGQAFSPDALAVQLQNLRSVIDQTLPLLSAFNENYSNSVSGGRPTIAGALSGIVTDVLHRNQQTGQSSAVGQSSMSATNLLSILHGLVNTNSTGASGAAPSNAQDLIALQADLQPVEMLLQRLNVSPAPNPVATPYNNSAVNNGGVPAQNYPNGNLTPTGR